jgi:hypothetical protein
MRRLTHFVVLIAFIFSCGGQWYIPQCVAWVNMVRDYSRMVSLKEAVEMTFSGEYPCPICKAITESKKQSDKDQAFAIEKYAKKYFSPAESAAGVREAVGFEYADYLNPLEARTEAPPTPPPRGVLG